MAVRATVRRGLVMRMVSAKAVMMMARAVSGYVYWRLQCYYWSQYHLIFVFAPISPSSMSLLSIVTPSQSHVQPIPIYYFCTLYYHYPIILVILQSFYNAETTS